MGGAQQPSWQQQAPAVPGAEQFDSRRSPQKAQANYSERESLQQQVDAEILIEKEQTIQELRETCEVCIVCQRDMPELGRIAILMCNDCTALDS